MTEGRTLAPFLTHKAGCAVGFGRCEWRESDASLCDCGLSAALAAVPAQPSLSVTDADGGKDLYLRGEGWSLLVHADADGATYSFNGESGVLAAVPAQPAQDTYSWGEPMPQYAVLGCGAEAWVELQEAERRLARERGVVTLRERTFRTVMNVLRAVRLKDFERAAVPPAEPTTPSYVEADSRCPEPPMHRHGFECVLCGARLGQPAEDEHD